MAGLYSPPRFYAHDYWAAHYFADYRPVSGPIVGQLSKTLGTDTLSSAGNVANYSRRLSMLGDSIETQADSHWNWFRQVVASYNGGDCVSTIHAAAGAGVLAGTTPLATEVTASSGDNSNILFIALGTNDGSATGLQAEIEEQIPILKASNPTGIVIYLNVWPRWTDSGGGTPVDRSAQRAAISAACTTLGVICWDTYTSPWFTAADTLDGLHPNASGHDKITAKVLELLAVSVGSLTKTLGTATVQSTAVAVGAGSKGRYNARRYWAGRYFAQRYFVTTFRLTATLAASLGAVALSAIGSRQVTATLSKSIGIVTINAAAGLRVTAALSKTLSSIAISSQATSPRNAALAKTLGAAVSTCSATVLVRASTSETLLAVTGNSTGMVTFGPSAIAQITLGAITAQSTSTVRVAAASQVVLGSVTGTATGTALVCAALSKTLGATSSQSIGRVRIAGSTSKTLGAVTSSAAGVVGAIVFIGTLSKTLGAVTITTVSTVAIKGQLVNVLGTTIITGNGTIAGIGPGTGFGVPILPGERQTLRPVRRANLAPELMHADIAPSRKG